MNFCIKHFDTTVLKFSYIDNGIKGHVCKIIGILKKTHLLPIGLTLSDEGIFSWLKKRTIPKNREYVDALLSKMGLSLFNYAMIDDFNDIETYAKTRISSYRIPFLDIVKEFITESQKIKIEKLHNFEFTRHKNYNLPSYRLKAIEKFLQKRITEILEI